MAPLLPLDSFRRIIGYNAWHFWGLADSSIAPVTSACNDLVKKYAWQKNNTDAAGREDILEAIEQAEDLLHEHLDFRVAPDWDSKTLEFPKFVDRGAWRLSHGDSQSRWLDVKLRNEGYVQKLGVETRTLIGTAAVDYSDADGDGLDETATISIATTVTDTDQIHIYFKSADRLDGDDVSEEYRIHPIKVSISGGTATIKAKSWLFVKPINYEDYDLGALDPTDSANFVTEVEVYRHYTNVDGTTVSTAQAKLIWETLPYPSWAICCGCEGSSDDASTDPSAEAEAVARAGIRHSEEGIVNVGRATYNTTTEVWESVNWGRCRPPERVTVRFQAGYPLSGGQMAKKFQRVVSRLAAAELSRRPAACDVANRELYRWQFDMARTSGANDEGYALVTREQLNNPLGTRRGHIHAWDFIQSFRNLEGFRF